MNKALVQIIKAKEEHRKSQVKLPYEQKINIVGNLQRRNFEIKSKVQFGAIRPNPQKKKSSR